MHVMTRSQAAASRTNIQKMVSRPATAANPRPRPQISTSLISPTTTSIVSMKIQMRQHGWADDDIEDEDDAEEWMTSTLHFASREAMANYFKYLFESNGGNGFETAILLEIFENSSLDDFIEKITQMSNYVHWDMNRNLNFYIYNDSIIN